MKSTQKGAQYEKEVKTILERNGWTVEGQHRRVMWVKDWKTGLLRMVMAGRDIYGCDLIAKKIDQRTRWIQVSTVENKSKKEQQVLSFPWTLEHESVELWLRIKGKKAFRVFSLEVCGDVTKYYQFIERGTEQWKNPVKKFMTTTAHMENQKVQI